jgi:hypothetical protein
LGSDGVQVEAILDAQSEETRMGDIHSSALERVDLGEEPGYRCRAESHLCLRFVVNILSAQA